jgi:hypothetical protein
MPRPARSCVGPSPAGPSLATRSGRAPNGHPATMPRRCRRRCWAGSCVGRPPGLPEWAPRARSARIPRNLVVRCIFGNRRVGRGARRSETIRSGRPPRLGPTAPSPIGHQVARTAAGRRARRDHAWGRPRRARAWPRVPGGRRMVTRRQCRDGVDADAGRARAWGGPRGCRNGHPVHVRRGFPGTLSSGAHSAGGDGVGRTAAPLRPPRPLSAASERSGTAAHCA